MDQILVFRDGDVATVTLSNPGKLNAVTAAMWRALREHFAALSGDAALRCVLVRGAGDAFAAGGDLEEFLTLRATREQARVYHGEWVAGALAAVRDCPVPVVAVIAGPCIGGGLEIAAQCDLRIAAASARFGAPINRLGFTMYPDELAAVLRLAGPSTTSEILLEGRILDADEALMRGLVTRVVADDTLEDEARNTVRRICAGAPGVARAHKRLIRALAGGASLPEAERQAALDYLDSADYREGLEAFLAKRPPQFSGR